MALSLTQLNEQMDKCQEEIRNIEKEIANVAMKIEQTEKKLEEPSLSSEDKTFYRKKEEDLRTKEDKLRTKEDKLRTEKDKLLTDRNILLMKESNLREDMNSAPSRETRKEPTNSGENRLLEQAFTAKFEGETGMSGHIRNRLDQYMSECARNWENKNSLKVYGPMCLISQSSGYGKTRMLYEVALRRIVTFICLRRDGENGFPPRTSTAYYFESDRLSSEEAAASIVYSLIENALNDVTQILARLGKSELDDTNITQVAVAYRENQHWQKRAYQTEIVLSTAKQCTIQDIENLRVRFKATMKNEPLLIVLDEAHQLFTSGLKSQFRYLRAAIYNSFPRFRIAIVLASTNSSINNYQIAPHQYSSSQRNAMMDSYIPFSWFIHTDSLSRVNEYTNELIELYKSHIVGDSHASSKPKKFKTRSLYEWLANLSPESSFFLLGRPLWTAYYNTQSDVMKQMSQIKILHPLTFVNGVVISEAFSLFICNTLSVLGSRTDFFIHRINPSYITACELVDKCMATLIDMDNRIGQITLRYVSEPILANAAADYMCQTDFLHDILTSFLHYLDRSSNKLSLGELGELAAELILLIAKDKAAVKKYPGDPLKHARPITVDELFTSLLGSNYDAIRDSIPPKIREGLVSFSHFCKKVDDLSIKDIFCDFIGRNAAGLFVDNFEGYDLFIPIVLKEYPWIGLIGIQGKNTTLFLSLSKLEQIHKKADPKRIIQTTDFSFDENNTITLIMDLVNPSLKLNKQVDDKCLEKKSESININSQNIKKPIVEKLKFPGTKHTSYLLRGSDSTVYPCLDETVSEKINELINLPRYPLRKYSRFTQKAGFNGARSIDSREAVSLNTELDPANLSGTAKNARRSLNVQLKDMEIKGIKDKSKASNSNA